MFTEILDAQDTLLYGKDMLQRSLDVHLNPRSAYITDTMITFSKWLYSL